MKVWRLDPPACECRNLCKNPAHDRPEFQRVDNAGKLEIWVDDSRGSDLNLAVEYGLDLDSVFYGTCLDTGDVIRVNGWTVDVDVVGPINLDVRSA